MHQFEFSSQKGNPPPREKIQGSQHIRREEKVKPKLTIRNPFLPQDRKKNSFTEVKITVVMC